MFQVIEMWFENEGGHFEKPVRKNLSKERADAVADKLNEKSLKGEALKSYIVRPS